MNQLTIAQTKSTPSVLGDGDAGILKMAGDSYPENSFEFFTEVIEWVERFLSSSDRPLALELRLVYMNTSSIKAMMDIFDILADAHAAGRQVSVNWYYDTRNERIAELAEEFKEDCEFPFVIAPDEQ